MDVPILRGKYVLAAHILALLLGGLVAPAWASAPDEDVQIKAISRRYGQVEAQLERSIHYKGTTTEAGETETRELWTTAAGESVKVATERTGPKGRVVKEYFPAGDEVQLPIFVLTRRETPLPDGGTQVDERRQFFGKVDGKTQMVRSLVKSAQFPAGATLDSAPVKNTAQDLAKLPPEEPDASALMVEEEKIADKLREGKPDRDPGAGIEGDSARFRLIHGTVSPDGRLVFAMGFARKQIEWDTYAEKDSAGKEYRVYLDKDTPGLKNYIVDLATRHIVGETGVLYNGTRARYNHDGCEVVWSPDSSIFVQYVHSKWSYEQCCAGRLGPGPRLLGVADLGAATDKQALAFLAAKKDAAWRKHRRDLKPNNPLLETLLLDWQVGDDGVIAVTMMGDVPKSDADGDSYSVRGRLRLQTGPKGVRLEPLDTRYQAP